MSDKTVQTNDQTIRAFEQAENATQIVDAFSDYLSNHSCIGFNAADFDQSDRSRLMLYTSMPELFAELDSLTDWWMDDPVLARLNAGEMRPFDVEEAWRNPLPSAAPRWKAITQAGLQRGIIFPTSKAGFIGAVHVICVNDDSVRAALNPHQTEMHAVALYMHAFMTELRPPPKAGKNVVRNTLAPFPTNAVKAVLSPRETSCLRWVALGKTAEDIALIEGISPHTVRHYLRDAMAKLHARTQAQAVARALKYSIFQL